MKKREEVALEDRWNVEALYPDQAAWEQAFKKLVPYPQQTPHWPSLQAYQGTFDRGPQKVKEALDLLMEIDRELTKLYTYAHLRHDEDIVNHRL